MPPPFMGRPNGSWIEPCQWSLKAVSWEKIKALGASRSTLNTALQRPCLNSIKGL